MISRVVRVKHLLLVASFAIVALVFCGCSTPVTSVMPEKPTVTPYDSYPSLYPSSANVTYYRPGTVIKSGLWAMNHLDYAANMTATLYPIENTPADLKITFPKDPVQAQAREWVFFPFEFSMPKDSTIKSFAFEVLVQNWNQTGFFQSESRQLWQVFMR